MFRHEQPEIDLMWGIAAKRGFQCDWWAIGGRAHGWGDDVRRWIKHRGHRPSAPRVPSPIRANAVRAADLAHAMVVQCPLLPYAIVTPHGEWIDRVDESASPERQRKIDRR